MQLGRRREWAPFADVVSAVEVALPAMSAADGYRKLTHHLRTELAVNAKRCAMHCMTESLPLYAPLTPFSNPLFHARDDVMAALRLADPDGVENRKSNVLIRRNYVAEVSAAGLTCPIKSWLCIFEFEPLQASCCRCAAFLFMRWQGPFSVTHCDGNDKLRKYGFLFYAAVDGFSRYCTFITCDTSNRDSAFLLHAYVASAAEHGGVARLLRVDGGQWQVIETLARSVIS